MVITGYARRVSASLNPRQIIAPEVAAGGDPAEIAALCLAAVDAEFAGRAREGDVLVVDGDLFGGEGAEAAVLALQAVGVAALICREAAAEVVAAGEDYGLPILRLPAAAARLAEGALLRLDFERGRLDGDGVVWPFTPLAPAALARARRAQMLARMRRVVEEEGLAEG
ncbi:MAG: hypothetical protein RMK84_16435 [Oscillochloridaceae bacterium]|nr:hypothetical protein [Chloroflexaceae bacterium]MDW8391715.1 hypothetical protein [Oscillochloridaceae bacterium]